MRFKTLTFVMLLSLSLTSWAQTYASDSLLDWKEVEAPPPPAFNVNKLLTFDVLKASSLTFGVDPASISIGEDEVVRYVIVATSPTGVRNVFYEGIRCATGEYKTYARQNNEGVWNKVSNPEWRSVFNNAGARHVLQFAKTAACDNTAPTRTVDEMVHNLKTNRITR
ncbi:MAG TPA: CNP1-like family protein [Polaromonas sp.]|uniref:CNP1-like family protein n=1 Tax=Polaromonas sp. TaxID=1869339 RepID=UPI002D5A6EEA|nr:CNP1-like family protein [Polaromonas sp.]HYW56351.1 CNP1-like family protein [Polaromonas sp.]